MVELSSYWIKNIPATKVSISLFQQFDDDIQFLICIIILYWWFFSEFFHSLIFNPHRSFFILTSYTLLSELGILILSSTDAVGSIPAQSCKTSWSWGGQSLTHTETETGSLFYLIQDLFHHFEEHLISLTLVSMASENNQF